MKVEIEPPNEHGVQMVHIEGCAEIACPSCGRKALVPTRDIGAPGVILRGQTVVEPRENSMSFACIDCSNRGEHHKCTVTIFEQTDHRKARLYGEIWPNNSHGPRLSHWLSGLTEKERRATKIVAP